MTYYRTCKNCRFEKSGCQKREEMRTAIKGLGITSIKFRCPDRRAIFDEGQRVKLTWRVFASGDDYDEETIHEFLATVMFEVAGGLRYIVRVDPGVSLDGDCDVSAAFKNKNLIIKARPDSMTAIDEPVRDFCRACFAYPDESRCHGWGRPGTWDAYWPQECPKKPAGQ